MLPSGDRSFGGSSKPVAGFGVQELDPCGLGAVPCGSGLLLLSGTFLLVFAPFSNDLA